MQEEFSCQVMQEIGQNCTYRVTLYAVRCGDTQNGVMSEPLEVNISGSDDTGIQNVPLFSSELSLASLH